jgi:hypothetical protein
VRAGASRSSIGASTSATVARVLMDKKAKTPKKPKQNKAKTAK